RRNSVPRRSGTRRGPTRAAAGESWPAVQEISLKLLPLYLGHGGVEAGTDTHAQDAVARLEARCLTGQGDGQGGGADVAELRVAHGNPVRIEVRGLGDRIRVHIGDLVHDVAVHLPPVPAGLVGFLPRGDDEFHAAGEQALGVGEHAVVVADAQFVVLGGRSGDPAEDAVTFRVLVGRPEDGGRGAGAQGQGGELVEVLLAGDLRTVEPGQGGLLDPGGVFAGDDEGVFD